MQIGDVFIEKLCNERHERINARQRELEKRVERMDESFVKMRIKISVVIGVATFAATLLSRWLDKLL